MARRDPDLFERTVAVVNGKGGTLKTSIVANVGGQLALTGMRVLVIDLDPQGNLKLELGMAGHDRDDDGRGLAESIAQGTQLTAVEARPGLDIVFGGRHLRGLLPAAYDPEYTADLAGGLGDTFADAVAAVAYDYDLILIDAPPVADKLQELALAAAGWVLIPTKTDPASWDGLLEVGPLVAKARKANPALRYLGMVVTGHNPAATRVLRSTREALAAASSTIPMLETTIRHTETATHDGRGRGQLAHELAGDATAARKGRLAALREMRREKKAGKHRALPAQLSEASGGLASDYQRLAKEICDRIAAAEEQVEVAQ